MDKLLRWTPVALALLMWCASSQARGRSSKSAVSQGHTLPNSLVCCTCLGQAPNVDLSTGQRSPVDTLWTVNNAAAYTTPPAPTWIAGLGTAQWIQTVASPLPASLPAGVSRYRLRFNVPDCTIRMRVRLEGKMAADNKATVYFDGNMIASCNGPDCFSTGGGQAPTAFNVASIAAGPHLLQIDVTNDASSVGFPTLSGLIVSAILLGQCQSCDQCPSIGSYDGANCYIGTPPPGTTAFIWGNSFYYTPVSGNQCPRPGSSFDGANCFVLAVPAGTDPFIYANSWYVHPGCQNQTDVENPPAQ